MTKAGKCITLEEVEAMGFFDDLDLSWQQIKAGLCSMELKREETEEGTEEPEVASEEGNRHHI